MIEVYLDNEQLEIAEDVSIGLTVSIASIEDPISASASFTQSIDVPRTAHNEAVFGHTEQILSPDIFNHSEHIAAIYEDGVELIKGKAYFEGATDTHYKVQIVGNEFDWLERIKDKKLNEIDSDTISQFREYETMTDEQRKAVFFALVEHGCWWQEVDDETIRREWVTYADLVPFVNLNAIMRSIFKGYAIDTGSVTDFLSRLYVTGQWKAPENADTLAEDNAFELSCNGRNVREVVVDGETNEVVGGKLTDNNPQWIEVFDTIEQSKGNIVMETSEESVGGETITHYSPYFEPTQALRTAYKLHLKYTSKMVNRSSELGYAYADTIHFGGTPVARLSLNDGVHWLDSAEALNVGLFREAKITPKPEDIELKESEKTDFYLELSDPSMYTEVVQISWKRYASITETKYTTIAQITSERTHFRAACYFDYNTNLTVDSTPRAAIGLKTKYGDIVVIGDAEQAWEILDFSLNAIVLKTPCTNENEVREVAVQLYQNSDVSSVTFDVNILTTGFDVPSTGTGLSVGFSCSMGTGGNEVLFSVAEATIEPVFNFSPKLHDDISLNDVGGEALATDMLRAIMHLFNLRIYANSDTKTVHILPYSEFYSNDVVDWNDRIDRDKGVEITTVGDNIGKAFKLTYAEENSVVADYNKHHKDPYLSWHTPLINKMSKSEYELQNSVFNPPISISARRIFPNSEGQYNILQLADAEAQDNQTNVDLANIPRTLVMIQSGENNLMYFGNRGLIQYYVQPIFTVADGAESISFSGEQGLHQHYDKQVDIWNYGKRITCYCRVEPQEIESLRKAGTSDVDFRSKFKLKINGEDIYCRLESIENYEPQNSTHKCTFIYFS